MLRIISGIAAEKSISLDSINEIGGDKMIVEASSKEIKTGFLIPGAKLAFADLKQTFNTTAILYHLDPKGFI